ncbi:hypothetical protein [uncultured Gemmiger sp.]|uniref:phage baseplate protein n=1 Tax=uncultured Gemmiger sp. TaxID=1623490 RepID=UPI0025FE0908|nr:hypothetical protein [uncultured Gemmiger sp.]
MSNFMSAALTVDDIYPVGSIYMSVNATDPARLFGGTWERIKEKFLLGAGDTHTAGSTGGEFEHKLAVDELPSHAHYQRIGNKSGTSKGRYLPFEESSVMFSWPEIIPSMKTSATGGDKPHNTTPPIWQCTSGNVPRKRRQSGVAA